MKKDKIIVNGKEYDVYIYQEHRNNTRVSIGKTGINIRLPLNMQREEIFKEVLRLKNWAIKKIREKPLNFKNKGAIIYQDKDILKVGNEEYILNIYFSEKKGSSAKVIGNILHINVSSIIPKDIKQKHISILLSRIVAKKKKQFIAERIRQLNEKYFNLNVRKIFLKYNTSNWGSCSNSNNINISTRLLFAPNDVIDYVCIHELAHLQERNHSAAFWNLVKKAMPDYKEKQKWLKENSDKCWF